MNRHTKIVATLGPASNDPQTLETLIPPDKPYFSDYF